MSLYYDLGNYANALMQIYDVNGKLVANYSLSNKNGVYLINESGLTNGIYFYKIVVNENVIHTTKLVIIK